MVACRSRPMKKYKYSIWQRKQRQQHDDLAKEWRRRQRQGKRRQRRCLYRMEKKTKTDQTKENEHQCETTSDRAAGSGSRLNLSESAGVAGAGSLDYLVAASYPSVASVGNSIGSLFSGCTFGNATFSIDIQHISSPMPQPSTLYTSLVTLNPGPNASFTGMPIRPRLRLLFNQQKE